MNALLSNFLEQALLDEANKSIDLGWRQMGFVAKLLNVFSFKINMAGRVGLNRRDSFGDKERWSFDRWNGDRPDHIMQGIDALPTGNLIGWLSINGE
jgi:hypothetical protein